MKNLLRNLLIWVEKLIANNARIRAFLQGSNLYPVRKIRDKRLNIYLKKLSEFPSAFTIEISTLCNADCLKCSLSEIKRPHTIMDDSLYKKIIKQCAAFDPRLIYLSWAGESLLDPTIVDKIKFAKALGIRHIGFFTNASLLDDRLSRQLISAGLDFIIFSIDSLNKSTYEIMQKGLRFDSIIANINSFIKLRNELGKGKRPSIGISFIEMKYNTFEWKQFRKYWQGKADYVQSIPVVEQMLPSARKEEAHFTSSTRLIQYKRRARCYTLWTYMTIDVGGRVELCTQVTKDECIMGDANKHCLMEIWNGEKFKHYRNAHAQNRFSELLYCDKCVWWKSVKGHPWFW